MNHDEIVKTVCAGRQRQLFHWPFNCDVVFVLIAINLADTSGVLIASSNASLQTLLSSRTVGLLFFVTDSARKDLLWWKKCPLCYKVFVCFLVHWGDFFLDQAMYQATKVSVLQPLKAQ